MDSRPWAGAALFLPFVTGMTAAIVPRWEWRTFGPGAEAAEARIRQVALASQKTREIYLLCDGSDANVKIRDGLLDVKTRRQVDAAGLEQWAPALKAAFPLAAADVAAVFALWQIPAAPPRTCRTVGEFIDAAASASSAIRAVDVEKERWRGEFDGCAVEVAHLRAGNETLRTLAVEDADPLKVQHAVRALGLADRENVNYVSGLKRLTHTPLLRPGRALV